MKLYCGGNDDSISSSHQTMVFVNDKASSQFTVDANESGGGVDENATDSILARELNGMDLEEREAMYEEIHGVDKITPETPQFLHEKLLAFEHEMRRISSKPAYDLAAEISPEFVSDLSFRLMFLRVACYDEEKAAIRCVKFMDEKMRLFGREPLARRLCVSDLSEDDMVCLKSGALQVLPQRDRAGRAVLGNFRNLIPRSYKVVDNMVGFREGRRGSDLL